MSNELAVDTLTLQRPPFLSEGSGVGRSIQQQILSCNKTRSRTAQKRSRRRPEREDNIEQIGLGKVRLALLAHSFMRRYVSGFLHEVAAKAGISLRYLQKLFTQHGSTCSEFIYSLRLEHGSATRRASTPQKVAAPK